MENEQLVIVIKGDCASGKTTLALALHDFLLSRGFTNVDVNDYDIDNDICYPALQESRMNAIKDRKVTINTIQGRLSW
jgi:uridine kinase